MLLTSIFNCVYIILRKYKKNIASLLFLLIYFNNIFFGEKHIFYYERPQIRDKLPITNHFRLEINCLKES